MSKKCIRCGAELEDNANFCDECGVQQTVEVLQTPPQMGKQAESSQEQVSLPQSTQNIPMPNGQVSAAKKNSGLGIVSLLMGVVGVCTLGVFFIPEILGLVFGMVAVMDRSHKSWMAVVGIVLSVIALVLGILAFIGSTL